VVIFWAVVSGFVFAVIAKTATDASTQEVRTRLDRLPRTILALAARALPNEERDDLLAEWEAELSFILRHTDGLPLTRMWRGLRFASSLALAGPTLACERGTWLRIVQVGVSALGVSLSGFGIFTLLDGGNYGVIGEVVWSFNQLTSGYDTVGLRTWGAIGSLSELFLSLGIVIFGIAVGVFGVVVPWLDVPNPRILNIPVDMFALTMASLGVSGMLSGSSNCYYTGWLGGGGSSLAGTILGCLIVAAAMILRRWWRRHATPSTEGHTATAAS
jgi:hypothetical protein